MLLYWSESTEMNKIKIFQLLFLTILPLVMGALIYIISRTNSNYFLEFLSIDNEKINFPGVIKFNIIDGLWAFSISSLLQIIWNWKFEKSLLLWFIILIVVSIYFEINFGTFDPIDILFISIGLIIPLLITTKNNLKSIYYEQKVP